MPRDMAMHQPSARVVRRKSEHDPATTGEEGDVAARRVVEVEVGRIGLLVEDAAAGAEDEEIVASKACQYRCDCVEP